MEILEKVLEHQKLSYPSCFYSTKYESFENHPFTTGMFSFFNSVDPRPLEVGEILRSFIPTSFSLCEGTETPWMKITSLMWQN